MMKPMRELTPKEIRSIRKLVTTKCANHDKEYGCLPLDCECPMLNICYTHSAMCSYFRESVLPNDPELSAAFQPLPTKRCKYCGKSFPVDGRKVYCSANCANAASREQTAARVRKHRKKKADKINKDFIEQIVQTLGLEKKLDALPNQLSGGQQQRVAIARALAAAPAIILADEPTGNLDSKTSQDVLSLLKVTSQKFAQTIVMITHNEEIAQMADRIIRIEDGRIVTKN